jgi:UDP-3-O-[3-hydroxymyristoyl] glucosamine N-acyltransferase
MVASVVGTGAVIGSDVILDHAVVGDGATVGSASELRPGARVSADAVLAPKSIPSS